jgi:hypothetical protein
MLLIWVQSAFALDPRAKACGAGPWPTLATFEVAEERLVRQHLPHMKGAPELNTDDPAYVVLFDGSIDLPIVGFGKVKSTPQTGVLCVYVRSVPEYYVDVDVTGWYR